MISYQTYTTGLKNDLLVIELGGRLDSVAAEFLMDCIEGFAEQGNREIVIDCSDLDYISSMGLATLVRANSRLKEVGGSVDLVQVPGLVADVINVAHLDRLFRIYDSVDELAEASACC